VIQLERIAKAYGGQTLFSDLSWRIATRERIGLVGPNGAGKTTLCRILVGLEAPDGGVVTRPRGIMVGYLPQEVGGLTAGSVLAEALSSFDAVWALEREMEEVATRLAVEPTEALTRRYGDLQHRFESMGGYRLESEAKAILTGLGFKPDDFPRPLAELSGGWRMRAALARLLLQRPPLLLLDEPTNHLDLASLTWLEGFLQSYDGTVVVVSHDRYFLNRMVTTIAEVGPEGISVYTGDYDHYLVEREARRALREAQARNQAKRVAEIERFIERFRYKATKARQVQSRIKMLERMDRIELDAGPRRIRFAFPEPPRTGRRVAWLRNLHKAYGAKVVYAGIEFDVERGERVALVGENGAGKSTLLRVLAGVLPFESGERGLGTHVAVHYYAQHQLDALTPSRTVLDEAIAAAPTLPHTRVRAILGAFLFSGDTVDKTVGVLSGGEKARLALARMLVRPAALLCLDEPTNHLDLASREVLEEALAEFPGTIVFISHDRYFINQIATRVVEVANGTLTSHPGGWDDYEAARTRAAEAVAVPAPAPPPSTRPTRLRRASSTGVKALQRRVEEVEAQIQGLESRLREITALLSDPTLYVDGVRARAVTSERKSAEEQVAGLLREWETLTTALGRD
jgi:ATP-binding cassette subfamily F protein 3